jgi:hypothetical protein
MQNDNTFLIEKLQHELTQDLDQWLSFQDLSEDEQNDICKNIASREYENHDDYDLAGNEGIYIQASEKMGYIREDSYKEDEENLKYNLSYSQGDHAYLRGSYNLQALLKNNGASKQLLKDFKHLFNMVDKGYWEYYASECDLLEFYQGYHNEKPKGFYIKRNQDRRYYANTTAEEFIETLQDFKLANGKTPTCVERILQDLEKNSIETAFENYEYNLKRELYDDMESLEECNKEYWIQEMLKPELKGKYNRATKQFIRDTTQTYFIN